MTPKARRVKDYLEVLSNTKVERTEQVKEGLEIYIDLWKRAIQKGVITESDSVDDALVKIQEKGGLYEAAGV